MKDQIAAPAALETSRDHIRAGDSYAQTFAVVGYPAEVGPAWLEPLLTHPGRIDVAVHVSPVHPTVATSHLRRQRARLESSRRIDTDKGRLHDPQTDVAADDAADLAERVARGAARLFDVGVYVTVHGRTREEMAATAAGVRSAAASTLLDLVPTTFRHQHGWVTTLPMGVDGVGMRRVLDTSAVAAAFPFAAADLVAPAPGRTSSDGAVLYGVTASGNGLLLWDRWSQDNHNSVILARSGAGKSYFVKLDILRSLYQGVRVSVIDPEDEYRALAEHVDGSVIALGSAGVKVNPFDLPAGGGADMLTQRGLFLHRLVAVVLGETPPPEERAALDHAVLKAYNEVGITNDPATWRRPAPLMRDLGRALHADPDPAAGRLAARLAPWTSGNFKDLFDGPTTTTPTDHLTVWSLRHLAEELRGVGTMLVLDAVWREVDATASMESLRRRLVVVDEAWLLMRNPEGARFLYRMAKAARKRSAGLTVVTQDVGDVLGSDLGLAVVSNAATQILMRQPSQAIEAVVDAFGLTAGEARLLLAAPRGEGLMISGRQRIPFRSVASPSEHRLATTGIELNEP